MTSANLGSLRSLVQKILDPAELAHTLRPEVLEMTEILARAGTFTKGGQLEISEGETRTQNGVAVSAQVAAMCADDYVRTIVFLRGVHSAIMEARRENPGRPSRLLYVGCGPYGTIVLPLLSVLSADDIRVTLLDTHPESIESVEAIIYGMGFGDRIHRLELIEASDYTISSTEPPDIVVMEIMQACLKKEPQVAITRHLMAQVPNAILVPEEVRVDLALIDPGKEFALTLDAEPERDRIELGPVFRLSRDTVLEWQGIDGAVLPGARVAYPASVDVRYDPVLFTRICVHSEHVLQEYDSGLTGPRRLDLEGAEEGSDAIQFHYELGATPQLVARWQG